MMTQLMIAANIITQLSQLSNLMRGQTSDKN